MATIASVAGRVIKDSRGQSTVEVTVTDDQGRLATASLPTGASVGKYEAHTVDADSAVATINTVVAPLMLRSPLQSQKDLDEKLNSLDTTPNRDKIGVNSTLAVSMAVARLLAQGQNMPLYQYIQTVSGSPGYSLPTPMFNLINGGKHATNNLDFQEYMVVPIGLKTFWEKVSAGKKIFSALGEILSQRNYSTKTGDEGGYAPNLTTNEEGMGLLVQAIKDAGYDPQTQVQLGLDVAASALAPTYSATPQNYVTLFENFPLLSIEDPFKEDEWEKWKALKQLVDGMSNPAHPHLLVGDDLFAGNKEKLKEGIEKMVAHAILVKMNQSATVTELLECLALARKFNYVTIISHRSGETLDTFVSDLAVGSTAAFIKAGAPNDQAAHRIVKYERIIQIEEELTVVRRSS